MKVYEERAEMTGQGVEVLVGSWSGNVRPWKASVYVDGVRLGLGGFCKSKERAIAAAVADMERKRKDA